MILKVYTYITPTDDDSRDIVLMKSKSARFFWEVHNELTSDEKQIPCVCTVNFYDDFVIIAVMSEVSTAYAVFTSYTVAKSYEKRFINMARTSPDNALKGFITALNVDDGLAEMTIRL